MVKLLGVSQYKKGLQVLISHQSLIWLVFTFLKLFKLVLVFTSLKLLKLVLVFKLELLVHKFKNNISLSMRSCPNFLVYQRLAFVFVALMSFYIDEYYEINHKVYNGF